MSIPVKRFVVIAPRTWRNCGPAIFWSASLIDFIPNIRSAREPKSLKITNNVIAYGRWVIIFNDAAKVQKKPIICNI